MKLVPTSHPKGLCSLTSPQSDLFLRADASQTLLLQIVGVGSSEGAELLVHLA